MSAIWAETAQQRQCWDDLLCAHPAGTPYLLSWYLDHQRLPRAAADIAFIEQNKEAAVGAVLYTFRLPGRITVCVVPSGPLMRPGHEKAARALIEALGQRARELGAILIQFEAFEPDMRDIIREAFGGVRQMDEPVWKLYHPTLWRELRVDLRGKTAETLLASFTTSARKRVKQGLETNVQIEEVMDDQGLDTAYELWISGGERKHYTIRPRESFRSLARATRAHDAGVVLLSRVDGRPAAFIHAMFYGCGSMYMSGAHDPEISQGFGNRVLQYRAMCMAIERNIPYYSLGGPASGGVREFKLGFRPELIDNMRFVTVMLRPTLTRMVRGLIGRAAWIQRAKRWATRGAFKQGREPRKKVG